MENKSNLLFLKKVVVIQNADKGNTVIILIRKGTLTKRKIIISNTSRTSNHLR